MHGDGDGWSAGPHGSMRWGLHGAAGLFLVAVTPYRSSLLLQHRAHWTADGGTWGIPGGARDSHETASETALRETVEETGIDPDLVEIHREIVTAGPLDKDPERPELPGGWTYTTVLATASKELDTTPNEESLSLSWVPLDQVASYPLLQPFAEVFPSLLAEFRALEL